MVSGGKLFPDFALEYNSFHCSLSVPGPETYSKGAWKEETFREKEWFFMVLILFRNIMLSLVLYV